MPMAWGGDQQERVSPGRMGRQDSHRYSTHSRTMCRMLSCHRTEAAQLQMPTDSMHLFCIKAQSIASNHRMNHKTDWQPCPSGSMTKNPKLFLLFVDRVSGSPSQSQAHCVVKDLLQFLFLHLPECWGYDETTGVSHHTQFVQSWESNPGLRALEASALPTEPHQQSLECLIQCYLQFLVCQQLCVAITSVWPSRLLE